jgi:hypothetical protein
MRTRLLIFCCALWAALPAQDCAHAIALGELSTWHTEAMPLAASAAEDAPCRPGGLPAAPSAWLAFTAPADLLLAFDLLPAAPEDDLDFVLYELPEGDCGRRRPLRCMAAGPHIGGEAGRSAPCLGATGLSFSAEGEQAPPGCRGRAGNYLRAVPALAGRTYALWVGNYTSTAGFTLQFYIASPAQGQERSPLQALRLFPNPAQDLVFLELDLPYSAPVRAIVQDATGRQLAISDFAGQAGLQRFELRSDYWVPGTYWVSVIVDGHREVLLVEKF